MKKNLNQKGNVFVVLLAAASMIGLVSYGLYNLMGGPVAGINAINQKTLAETQILMTAELIATKAVNAGNNGDCDADDYVEPVAWRVGTGPANGGLLPQTLGAPLSDPWGTQYGYCVWDLGATSDDADCGGPSAKRLDGANDLTSGNISSNLVMAIVSAGPNRTHNSSCAAYTNGTTPVFTAAQDDVYKTFTYGEAAMLSAGAGSDLWFLKDGDATTAQTAKNLEIGASASVSTAGDGVFTQVTANELTSAGAVVLTSDDTLTSCTSANEGVLRYNNNGGIEDVQVCMEYGGVGAYEWKTVGTVSDQQSACPAGAAWYNYGVKDICFANQFSAYHVSASVDSYALRAAPVVGKARLLFAAATGAKNNGAFRAAYHTDNTAGNNELYYDNIGTTSLAMGRGAKADCTSCLALGSQESNIADTAAGNVTTTGPRATGSTYSYAIGTGATANASNSLALGERTSTTGTSCVAIGLVSSCASPDAHAIGESNNALNGGNLAIGYGGTTAIGNAAVLSTVNGSTVTNTNDTNITATYFLFGATARNGTNTFQAFTDTNGTPASEELKVYSVAGGNWTAISDRRIKDVLRNYTRGLEALSHIQPHYYFFKGGNALNFSPKPLHLGLVAQEVKPWFPEAVTNDEDGYLALDPNPVFIARVNAYKELKKQHDALKEEISDLEKKLGDLEQAALQLPPAKPGPFTGFLFLAPVFFAAGAAGFGLKKLGKRT